METKSNSLLKNTLLYSIGNLASKGLSFILVFFTTFYLSREDVGVFDLFLTTISLLTPIVTLQLTDAVLRWLIENNQFENKARVLTTSSFILLISIFITIVGVLIFQNFYPFLFYKELLFLLGFQSFFLLFQQFQRAIADNKGYVLSSVFYTFLYVFLAILFLVFFDKKIEGLLYSNIIAAFFSTVFIVFRNKVFSYIHGKYYSFQVAKELLFYSIPLVPNSLSWWVISSANRYLIVLFLGVASNGIFAIAFKFPTIVLLLVNVFYLAWQEKAIENYNREDKDDYYSTIFKKYIKYLFVISINLLSINQLFLTYFVDITFYDSWRYTSVLLLAILFNALSGFYGTIYLGAKKTKSIFLSSLISGIIVLLLSYFLIPILELLGAAIAIFFGYFFLFLFRLFETKKYIKIEFPFATFFVLFGVFMVLSVIMFLELPYGIFWLPLVALVISCFLLQSELQIVYNKYLKKWMR